MSKVKIQGNAGGTGIFTVAAPATNTDRTITLPDVDATVMTTAGGTISGRLTMREDATDSSFRGAKIQNLGGSGAVSGLYLQSYDWVQGGIWHGRAASGTNRSGALVLGTNPNTADLTESGLIGRLLIDNAGRVTKPYQPAFDAYGTTGDTSFSAEVPLPLNSTVFNIGGHYNASTYRFTAPVAGLYFFRAHTYKQASSGYCRLRIRKNTTTTAVYNIIAASGVSTQSIDATVYLNTNDYVDCSIQADSSTALYLADNHTNFSGYLIG